MRHLILTILLFFFVHFTFAQSSGYTIFQGGANLGFANEGYKGAFNGYHLHFIFGKNFNERAYVGLGIGNEKFQGDYQTNDPHEANQKVYKYEFNTFPIFIDGRLPIGSFNDVSRIGLMANAGYAPAIGPAYDKGALFKAGFFYLHDGYSRTKFTAALTYGYQQLTKNIFNKDFQHQSIHITVGLMLK
ncbi:hypothetical protein VJ786_15090 [Sphingobacterium sp. PU5-4]|uniref:Outer membrane protein beta-barrel domain-containing protein n=1 Tax=Sphingobacterium tenebrionis TaxID=3111775 RepID=A0ABU8I9Q1_9SPHI